MKIRLTPRQRLERQRALDDYRDSKRAERIVELEKMASFVAETAELARKRRSVRLRILELQSWLYALAGGA